jgi:hypothetical protein
VLTIVLNIKYYGALHLQILRYAAPLTSARSILLQIFRCAAPTNITVLCTFDNSRIHSSTSIFLINNFQRIFEEIHLKNIPTNDPITSGGVVKPVGKQVFVETNLKYKTINHSILSCSAAKYL